MIRTRVVSRIEEVPSSWIFEYYLNLSEKLVGQSIVIKSVFNPKDSNPSMHVNPNKNTNSYSYNDFSTGKGGYGAHLVCELYSLKMRDSIDKIMDDYNDFIYKNPGDYTLQEYKEQAKYQVVDYVKRSWTTMDKNYWTGYEIASKTLDKYNVTALESYTMSNGQDEFTSKKAYIYGYFREDGTLYKIYQPKIKEKKFLKMKCYIQGTDQLTLKSKYLLIGSSLKDIMCLDEMGFGLDLVAPDSESILIKPDVINSYKLKYKQVISLFDNDTTGHASMLRYQKDYNIPGVLLPLEKDVSDSVKKYSLDKVKEILHPIIKQTLNTCQILI